MNVRQKAELLARSLEKGPADAFLSGDADLRSLHDLGQELRQVRHPELDTAALIAGAARVREALWARRRSDRAGRPRWFVRLAWSALALLLLLVVTTTGTALAAESSLPGQPLYPVKRASEAIRLALTWQTEGRAWLQIEFAERRLAEVAAVCGEGECPTDLLDDLGVQTQEAQEEVARLPVDKSAALLDRMVALTGHQEQVLSRILETAPDAAHPGLERALERSQHGHERAQQARKKGQQEEKGQENSPAVPTHVHKPTKAPHGPPITPPGKGSKKP